MSLHRANDQGLDQTNKEFDMQQYKCCLSCKQTKSLNDFHNRTVSKDGKSTICKDCTNAKKREVYAQNPEKYRAQSADYRKKYPERVAISKRNWKRAHPEQNTAHSIAHQKRNPHLHNKNTANYRKKNLELYRSFSSARRAKIASNGIYIITSKELKRLVALPCAYCQTKNQITIDHIIPIDRGGRHSIGNLQPLCLSCNSSKKNKFWYEWKRQQIGK